LLDAEEKGLFRSMSVFAGGCTYEAAEEVCEAEPDSLKSLLDKSLLRRRDSQTGPRYWMLETIREFAAERLEESAEAEEVGRRHALRHARLAVELYLPLREYSSEAEAILADEQGNMRAALDFALRRDDAKLTGDLISGLWYHWLTAGSGAEAADWTRRYLTSGGERLAPLQRYAGDLGAAEVLRFTGDPETAAKLKREMVETGRAHPEALLFGKPIIRSTAATLSDLAYIELDAGRVAEARVRPCFTKRFPGCASSPTRWPMSRAFVSPRCWRSVRGTRGPARLSSAPQIAKWRRAAFALSATSKRRSTADTGSERAKSWGGRHSRRRMSAAPGCATKMPSSSPCRSPDPRGQSCRRS
jgi:hypothetical protein